MTLPVEASVDHEHSVPFFWPFAAALTLGEQAVETMQRNLDFAVEAGRIEHPPEPEWATANTVRLDLATMRLREFGGEGDSGTPVLIDAPFAGHSSTIADYAEGQSLVQTLMASGISNVFATDWKPANAPVEIKPDGHATLNSASKLQLRETTFRPCARLAGPWPYPVRQPRECVTGKRLIQESTHDA